MAWKFYNSSGQLLTALADIVSTGALNTGSITSGFGTIDTGSSTLGSGAITSTGTVTATGFTIGSAAITETELEILDGATVTTTELNLIDGNTSRGTTAVASGDGILINDAGTMAMTNVDTVSTYFAAHNVGGGNIVTVGTIGTGTWQGTVVAAAYLPDASPTAQGVAELATTAETSTGTDTGRTVTPDGLAGSIHGEKVIQMVVIDFATALTTGNGKFYFHVPSTLNGFDIVDVHAEVISAPAGSTIIIQLHNLTATADILTTLLTIDASETGSDTAAAAAVISGSEDDLTTNDVIRVDIDQVGSSTAGSGLIVTLICRLP
jgi:hypothetical protein